MPRQRYVIIGAGEVGSHLARLLSQAGHDVIVVELRGERCRQIEEELDVTVVKGSGAHVPVLQAAGVEEADLVMAVSSSDEVNMVASLLAKHLGARRTVVRVKVADDVIRHRRIYCETLGADMLLSTQLLTTHRILDFVRGHSTVAVEYLAEGKVQLRKVHLEAGSLLTKRPLRELELPEGSLVVAFFRQDELIVPSGDDRARPGDDALILAKTEVIAEVERMVTPHPSVPSRVVIAGGGETGSTVAEALERLGVGVKLIERQRDRAEELAARFPRFQVLNGDATDLGLLRSERVAEADSFVALTGHDERNLMASLLAQELGVPQVVALVQRGEAMQLWRRLGLMQVVAPRTLAYERIREYIENGFNADIVSLQKGAVVLERRLAPASAAAGVTLAEMSPPKGLIVGAVARGRKVFVPRGADRLEVGDTVILFVRQEELDTARLLFPGRDRV